MFVLINGAFGVGKSTVARELRSIVPRSAIFDPEWIGIALQRLPGRSISDFQDLPAWRRWTVRGARWVGAIRRVTIVPMAISNLEYLDEILWGLEGTGERVLHFCLTAPIDQVNRRLAMRGDRDDGTGNSWTARRAAECCIAHRSPEFEIHVPTEGRSPSVVAEILAARLRSIRAEDESPSRIDDAYVRARRASWIALSELWLDTELSADDLERIARVLAESRLSIQELRQMHFWEVAPVVAWNALDMAGVWEGFDEDQLCERIVRNLRTPGDPRRRTRLPYAPATGPGYMLGIARENFSELARLVRQSRPSPSGAPEDAAPSNSNRPGVDR